MPSLETLMTGEDTVSVTKMTFPSVVRQQDYIDRGERDYVNSSWSIGIKHSIWFCWRDQIPTRNEVKLNKF